jgi:hypothetical protein
LDVGAGGDRPVAADSAGEVGGALDAGDVAPVTVTVPGTELIE